MTARAVVRRGVTAVSLPACLVLLALLVLTPGAGARAGGPLLVTPEATPFRWPDGGGNIIYNPDLGGLGRFDNDELRSLTANALQLWTDLPTATVAFSEGEPLAVDVNETNFVPFLFGLVPDGLSPLIWDEDGAIFDALFGEGALILGFALPDWLNVDTGEIVEGYAVLNGAFADENLSDELYQTVIVHEFGHLLNLNHSIVNAQIAIFDDSAGPTPIDTFAPESVLGRVETMAPRAVPGGEQRTPGPDDQAALSAIYPAPGWRASVGRITGRVLGPDGVTPISGVNVIARNIDDPYDDALSSVSSTRATTFTPDDPYLGVYVLEGLTPGARYAIYIDELIEGAFREGRASPLPGPEELYNGIDESFDPFTDDPAAFTPITAVAGGTIEGVDIVINRLPPGPLDLRRNSVQEIFLPFAFDFCGDDYTSVFVSSNGNLTFGRGDQNRMENRFAFLLGLPRIAALWDNLDPAAGGEVFFDADANRFVLSFRDVPETRPGGANSFDITLHRQPARFVLDYHDISARDGLAGYSCGPLLTLGTEEEVDLTSPRGSFLRRSGLGGPALYEQFDGDADGTNDLSGQRLVFNRVTGLRDRAEPNDEAGRGRPVRLPYDTLDLFTQIEPEGSDVDRFRLRARAGELLVVETSATNFLLDTVVGVFDSRGNLLATDDDSGLGAFARLLFPVPRDDRYEVAVTTFPDLEFDGGGVGRGRYRLEMRTVRENVLFLGDDDTVELDIGFPFPFQGRTWSTVFLNSNGNVTFGEGETFPLGVAARLFSGPPRIAALWDDLDPGAGGLVLLDRPDGRFIVTFDNVPEYFGFVGSTFSMELRPDGEVIFTYGATHGNDGLVGLSPGDGAADPGAVDLSDDSLVLSTDGTTYEVFPPGTFDLDGKTLSWRPGAPGFRVATSGAGGARNGGSFPRPAEPTRGRRR